MQEKKNPEKNMLSTQTEITHQALLIHKFKKTKFRYPFQAE